MAVSRGPTYDVDRIKSAVDCRLLIGSILGKPKLHSTDYDQFLCPFHAEKTPSFTVWGNGWKCFGGCATTGDCIEWVQRYYALNFEDAVRWLAEYANLAEEEILKPDPHASPYRGVTRGFPQNPNKLPEPEKIEIASPPTKEWQAIAMQVVERAEELLWSDEGEQALTYLREQRGLWSATIETARLGFVPDLDGRGFVYWKGLKIPCGITIPWVCEKELWGVKVRRGNGKHPRYLPISTQDHMVERLGKGQHSRALYWVDDIYRKCPLLITEGEFDCLTAYQNARDYVSAVTCGPAGNKINARWHPYLGPIAIWYACYDPDEAGQKAAKALTEFSDRVRLVSVPQGKDINEFQMLTSDTHVTKWIESIVTASPVPTR